MLAGRLGELRRSRQKHNVESSNWDSGNLGSDLSACESRVDPEIQISNKPHEFEVVRST